MNKTYSERAKFWQQHIDAAKSFPGSAQHYCDVRELKVASFYQWRKRLSKYQLPKKSAFLPVIVAQVEQPDRTPEIALPNAQWVAEVMLHLIRGLA
jgi:hypothetical protein